MQERGSEFSFVSIAVDTQGPELPRRYAADTLTTFPTLLDADNALGQAFGFKAIPNGILVSADGRMDAVIASSFEVRRPETKEMVERWLAAEDISLPASDEDHNWSDEALSLFRQAGAAVRLGDSEKAVDLLRKAFPLEPDNFIIRKQLWAIEHPEMFYNGDVDYDWQRRQMKAGS